ncbi:MAG TPA: rod shape-determining protein MreC [Pyrinomonadaceae bacterium]|jgi:rod shape-determining protein MreC|nr:rod shape-determining protein MreC [Pyrinomonadaceae bacterium]
MVRSTQKEIRQRAPLWLVVLLALNFGLMTWNARDAASGQPVIKAWAQSALSPAQRVTTGLGGAGIGFFRGLAEMRNARAENEALRTRLAQAENEVRDAKAVRDENERLKKLLDFTQDVSYRAIPARIVARDPSVWFNSLIINRGTASGVDLDMPVVTPEGIVGRVVGVGPVSAQVMLITDERSAAGAAVGQLGQSNAIGSVRGFGKNGLLEMRYVSGLETVNVGDYVVTTGQDRIYPPGLNVGTVVEVKPGTTTTPHTIYVRPGARLESLQEVAVLDYRAQQRTAPEKTLPNVDKGKK